MEAQQEEFPEPPEEIADILPDNFVCPDFTDDMQKALMAPLMSMAGIVDEPPILNEIEIVDVPERPHEVMHTGICMGDYERDTCGDCLMEDVCLQIY